VAEGTDGRRVLTNTLSSRPIQSPALVPGAASRFLYALGPVFIVCSHLGCSLVLVTGLGLGALLWGVALYLLRMLAITAVVHRLIAHRSYQAVRPVWWIGSLLAASAGQMGPSWWKAHHQQHHRHVDGQGDPHTPLLSRRGWRGFWHSQLGWLLTADFQPERLPADVEVDPLLRLIDRGHLLPPLALAWLSWHLGGLPWLAAFCLSTTVLFHAVASVNSVAHLSGSQPFATGDGSRNNPWVALLTLGEGWHNLHHAFAGSARQGISVRNGQIVLLPDPTYRFIQLLARLGLASALRIPSDRALLARAAGRG